MILRLESAEHPHPLALLEPLPLTRHPAAVYLSQLAESSRRTMGHNLNWCARVLSAGQCDRLTLDWAKLRYEHTAALRAILMEIHPPSTGNLKLSALKQTLKAARKLRLIDADDYEDAVSIKRITGDAPLRGRLLQPQEIQALVRVCQESETAIGTRDAAALACFCAGLRRAEVVALDYGDCDFSTGGIFVRQGKGKKYRQTYLIPGGLELLENWVSLRGRRSGPLFYPCQWWGEIVPDRRITSEAIALRLQEWGKVAGLESFSAHDFRRTFISNLLDKGVDIATVQQLVGHSNIGTTARYDRRGEETKRAAVQKLGF
ncbi:tyrosine-type recombinase/integrase [Laspinema olomoucense]|uniref:tyrosine-type recombinase/integrase n=1 Tax=Laspinema olomoucense TaxID=3231600 RepID=UPI0021BA46B9|nr:site-specific integrase [Laspinema sp. D3d]MCT7975249.1 site-specific integrase [Laspinema sp. D3d]